MISAVVVHSIVNKWKISINTQKALKNLEVWKIINIFSQAVQKLSTSYSHYVDNITLTGVDSSRNGYKKKKNQGIT